MRDIPDRYPAAVYCQGLVERHFGRDRCITCRGCRERRDVVPFSRVPATVPSAVNRASPSDYE